MGGTDWECCRDKRDDPCGCRCYEATGGSSAYSTGNVTCNGGHITAIELRENKLSGTLPVEWSKMTQITKMFLNQNQLLHVGHGHLHVGHILLQMVLHPGG